VSVARSVPLRVALFALVVLTPASAMHAQHEARVSIRTGFVPDPADFEGHVTGVQPLAPQAGADCVGFFGTSPSHVFSLDTRFGLLRFYATAQTNLVLAARTEDGHWICNDDRFGTTPAVEGTFRPGRIEIWVGTHEPGVSVDYLLQLTETRSVRPGVGAMGIEDDRSLAVELGMASEAENGRFDGIRLRRGFLPDPRWLEGDGGPAPLPAGSAPAEAEDPIDVALIGTECRGLVDEQPSHVITLLDDFDFLQLFLCSTDDLERCVTPGEPLSFVALGPDGRFRCDVSEGQFTELSTGSDAGGWPAGAYRVWIGVHTPEVRPHYRMGISEIRRVR
jgi:hypothetical protein